MINAQTLHNAFLNNGMNEAGRPILKSLVETTSNAIKSSLNTLIRVNALKSAIETPNSNYDNFISGWNSGAGALLPSFNRETAFWNSLQTAKNALDPLIATLPVLAPERAGQRGTAAERALFTQLRSETNELYGVFETACKTGDQTMKTKILEHVRVIGGVLNNSSLGQDAGTELTGSKAAWAEFNTLYKNGQGICIPAFRALGEFKAQALTACLMFLKS
jgi:hypothetical protein